MRVTVCVLGSTTSMFQHVFASLCSSGAWVPADAGGVDPPELGSLTVTVQPVKPNSASFPRVRLVAAVLVRQLELRPLMKSSSEPWSWIRSASCPDTSRLKPAGGVTLRRRTVTPPSPLSYARSGGAAVPSSRFHSTAQSCAGSPEVEGMTASTPWITHSTLVVSCAGEPRRPRLRLR
jgi:hypothetical protein